MKTTKLLERQHRVLVSFATALESERFCRSALLRDFADEMERHLEGEAHFAAALRLSPRVRAMLDASRRQLRHAIERMRDCHDEATFAELARDTRATMRAHAALYERELCAALEPASRSQKRA
jgi:hypothetical protein